MPSSELNWDSVWPEPKRSCLFALPRLALSRLKEDDEGMSGGGADEGDDENDDDDNDETSSGPACHVPLGA